MQHPLLGWWPLYFSAREGFLRSQTSRWTSWESSLPIFTWVRLKKLKRAFRVFHPSRQCVSNSSVICRGGCKSFSLFARSFFSSYYFSLFPSPHQKIIFYSFILAFKLYNFLSWKGQGCIFVFGCVHSVWFHFSAIWQHCL